MKYEYKFVVHLFTRSCKRVHTHMQSQALNVRTDLPKYVPAKTPYTRLGDDPG